MALDKGFTEFDVSVPRDRNQPLGIQIFRKKSTLTILRIHKQQVEAMKDRQLMIGDVVLSVNDKSDIQEMLLELKDINADKCNLSVRRYVTVDNAPTTVPSQLHGIPETTPGLAVSALHTESFGETVQASSTAQHSHHEPQNSHAITIDSYNPGSLEKYRGYLTVVEGTVVTVQSRSRTAAAQGNAFTCDYVFVWLANHEVKHDTAGWVPVNILGNIPPCQDIVHEAQF